MDMRKLTNVDLRRMLVIAAEWAFEDDVVGTGLWAHEAKTTKQTYTQYQDTWVRDYKQALYDRMLEYTTDQD